MSAHDEKRSLVSRLVKGVAANGFGQVVTFITSIVTIPLFFKFWGPSLYGEWLILSAVPSYLSMSDLSFGTTAGSEMIMLAARGERVQALKVMQSAWILVTLASLVILAAILAVVQFFDFRVMHVTIMSNQEARSILILLALGVTVAQQGGLLDAVFKCAGMYAKGLFYMNLYRLCELVLLLGALFLGGDPWLVALSMLLPKVAFYILMWSYVRVKVPWLHLGWSYADMKTLKPLVMPALTFNAFNLGYGLSLQGVAILIGIRASPADLAVFSPLRTLTRVMVQVASMIGNTVWVELSRAVGAGDMALARKIHRSATRLSVWAVVPCQILALLLGPAFFRLWTGQELTEYRVLLALVVVTSFSAVWSIAYVVPMSMNKHQSTALAFLGAAGLTIALAAWWTGPLGAFGACLAIIVGEAVMVAFVVPKALSLLGDELKPYLVQLITPPTDLVGPVLKRVTTWMLRKADDGHRDRT